MYIRQILIKNIRSIEHFEMTFPEGKEAGWHVLIGDNGSGKSTIVRAIALGLLDYKDILASGETWNKWLNSKVAIGGIGLISIDTSYQSHHQSTANNLIVLDKWYYGEEMRVEIADVVFRNRATYSRLATSKDLKALESVKTTKIPVSSPPPSPIPVSVPVQTEYWFSASYGPFRRFTGGNPAKDKHYESNPDLGAHLSVFNEDVALTEALSYLVNLHNRTQNGKLDKRILDSILNFVNKAKLLPHQTTISSIDSDGVYFNDAAGSSIAMLEMSDGYRSVLSMTFELIRQLIRVFGTEKVIEKLNQSKPYIDLPGVVLIDEVDAHLHPNWQDSIGEWLTHYFPKIQFIVTTHSPLVCRAAIKGSIWRLPTPGSGEEVEEVIGAARENLLYGNILEAYGTEKFGKKATISEEGNNLLNELAGLNVKSMMGQITPQEEQRMADLQRIFPTEQHPQ